MSASDAVQPRHVVSVWRQALPWVGAGVVAFPLVVLLHELGHYLVFLAFRVPGAVLHFGSAQYAASAAFERRVYLGDLRGAAEILPIGHVAAATAAGIIVTYLTLLACCYIAARRAAPPLAIAVGLLAPLRFMSLRWLAMDILAGRPVIAHTDEGLLIMLTGVPPLLLVVAGLGCWIAGWIWLIRCLPRHHRALPLTALFLGTAIGVPLYAGLIGPWLLP